MPIKLGKNVVKNGIYVINIRAAIAANRNGTTAFDISARLISAMLHATYRFTPTGGVICPIARLTVMITPNSKRSTPTELRIGIKIGSKI